MQKNVQKKKITFNLFVAKFDTFYLLIHPFYT